MKASRKCAHVKTTARAYSTSWDKIQATRCSYLSAACKPTICVGHTARKVTNKRPTIWPYRFQARSTYLCRIRNVRHELRLCARSSSDGRGNAPCPCDGILRGSVRRSLACQLLAGRATEHAQRRPALVRAERAEIGSEGIEALLARSVSRGAFR
eukprot:3276705-Pleurochrysis_carterae.AAC.4